VKKFLKLETEGKDRPMTKKDKEEKNISRRNFLKKMAATSIFVPPTVQTFSVLQQQSNWNWWTAHHHHSPHGHSRPTPPPPPPPGLG